MRTLAIVHQPDAGSGVFADVLRQRGVESDEWAPPDAPGPPRELGDYDAVLTFGGSMHADQEDRHPWLAAERAALRDLLDRGIPVLGVCLGAQLVAGAAGAQPRRLPTPEIGWHEVELTDAGTRDPLLSALPTRFEAFEWHSYEFPLPAGALALARSPACLQSFRLGDSAWAIQFHAEVTRADAEGWITRYRDDADAVRIGVDPDRRRAELGERIDTWNELGRALCGRFVDLVAERRATRA
ncbi:MAG TPA: type 1 glutamine amidotransferase [Solirubrobacterales bacterium]|nr:type 1 glutamine amidotransferase [Solirubrobacterales bacterium]